MAVKIHSFLKNIRKIKRPKIFFWRGITRRNKMVTSLVAVVFVLFASLYVYNAIHPWGSAASWFNENWGYRESVPVVSTEGSAQNNVFISFNLDTATLITAGKLQSSCQDLRITDQSGNVLKYHVGRVTACNNAATTIDVLLSSFPDGKSTYYVYYGNPSAPSTDAGVLTVSSAVSATVTTSGGLITDATRTTNTEGDGLTPPAGYGIWSAATNLITNGGFETNTTGWVASTLSGDAAITRSATQAKFGSDSVKLTASSGTLNSIRSSGFNYSPSTTYTLSGWFYIESIGAGVTTVGLNGIYDSGPQHSATVNLDQSKVGQWQHLSVTFTTNSGSQAGTYVDAPRINGTQTGSTVIYVDGLQVETGSIATPYIETNGGTASRTAGQVTADSSVLNSTQGWIALRTYMPWASNAAPVAFPVLWDWRTDANNDMQVYVSQSQTNQINFTRRSGGVGTANALTSKTWSIGDSITVIFAWTGTQTKASFNGGAFTSWSDTNYPSLPSTFNLLGVGTGNQWDSNVLWATTGKGTLTDTDASTLNGYGNTPPTTTQLAALNGGIGIPTFLWPAATSADTVTTYSQSHARNYTVSSLGTEELSPAPVAYWKFDEGTGTTAKDSSSNGRNGTINGSTWQTENQCISGKCLYLNGAITDYIIRNPNVMPTSAFSVGFWVKSSNTTKSGTPFSYAVTGTDNEVLLFNYNNFVIYVNGNNTGNTGVSANDGKWHYMSLTWQSSDGSAKLYKDGALAYSGTISSGTPIDSGGALVLGQEQDAVGSGFDATQAFLGNLDDFKIYNYVRTATQIQSDYNSRGSRVGTANSPTANIQNMPAALSNGLVGYWKMDETTWNGTASEVVDSSGNGNNGKAMNSFQAHSTSNSNTTNTIIDTGINWVATNQLAGATITITGGTDSGDVRTISANNTTGTITVSQNWTTIPDSTSTYTVTSSIGVPANAKFFNGGDFNGQSQAIQIPTSTSLSSVQTGDFTVGAWFNTNSSSTAGADIFTNDTAGTSGTWYLNSNSISAGVQTLSFRLVGSSSVILTTTNTFATNTWHHMMGVVKNGVMSIYVDGVFQVSTAAPASISTNSNTLGIGVGWWNNGSAPGNSRGYFWGKVDEARIYNRALSANEISQLYNWAPGPVGYWNFEEGQGTTVNDTSGNGHTGAWSGTGTHWGQGKYGKGGKFNGTDDSVRINTGTILNSVSEYTLTFWMNINTQTSNFRRLFSAPSYASPGPDAPYVYFTSDGTNGIYGRIGGTTDGWISQSGGLTNLTGGWKHVAISIDASGNQNMYVNGVFVQTISKSGHGAISLSDFYFGSDAGSNYFLQGSLDEVKIYNYVLTTKQIVSDMNANAPGVTSKSPVGYWKFNEGYGTTTGNSGYGGTANVGTLTGAVWKQDGKFGKSLYFADNLVTVGGESTFDFTSDFSLSFWINVDPANSSSYRGLISKNAGATSGWDLGIQSSKVRMTLRGTSNLDTSTVGNNLGSDAWHHVAVVNTPTAVYVYNDGVLTSTTTGTWTATTNDFSVLLGGRTSTTGFSGRLDEVKIYNYALSASDVKTDYNRGGSQVLGAMSNTVNLTGGSVASNSASAEYCVPGDSTSCAAPVGRWDFEEGQGTTTNDSSGNANTGTLTGSTLPAWTSGKIGKSLSYSNSASYVNAGTSSTLSPASTITVEAWAYPTTLGANQYIVSRYYTSGDSTTDYEIQAQSDNTWRFVMQQSDLTLKIVSGGTVTANTWTHIVGVADGSFIRLYVNGVQVGTPTAYNGTINTGVRSVVIGRARTEDTFGAFTGKIDQVRVFNYGRSAAQVAWDYNNGKPVGYWKMDECQGTTVNDSSGNRNTATLVIGATGTQTTVGTCLTPTDGTGAWYNGSSGKYNSSMNFDGTDDRITASLTGTPITTAWTIGYWANIASIGVQQNNIFLGTGGGARVVPYITTAGLFRCFTSVSDLSSGVTISASTWYHLACAYDGTTLRVYVNGRQVASGAQSLTLSANNVTIGADNSSLWTNGKLDDVRMYNYALTASQLQQVYNQGAAVRFGPLTGSP